METERITLSQRERDRLKVLREVKQKHLSQVAAAARLKVTDRQVRRMLLRIRERGDAALVHGLRGRPSNRKLAARLEQKILARLRQRYADFGPTLAAEHLAQEGFPVNRETLRKWMSKAALWCPRSQRVKAVHVCAGLRRAQVEIERRLDGSHWLRFRGRYLRLRHCPAPLRPSASPSGLRPPGLAERTPRPKTQIKPKYHVPAGHPWRKPWNRTLLLCVDTNRHDSPSQQIARLPSVCAASHSVRLSVKYYRYWSYRRFCRNSAIELTVNLRTLWP
jgi:transposase